MQEVETTDALLDDPGDLAGSIAAQLAETGEATVATGDAVMTVTETLVDDDPVHLAKCAECATAVRYRSNITGSGFFLVDADPDAVFGVGENGRPVCPNGHGEMAVADDQLKPIADAFADAQTMLQNAEGGKPVQRDLPGILPAFNYQGCYLELEEKAAEVDALHEEFVEAKEVAAKAKKAWESAAELQTKMALEFRRRRQAKGEPDAPSTADPVSRALGCAWDKAHPDEACPFCLPDLSIEQRAEIVRILGAEILPREANGHADQVVEYRTRVDVQETIDAIDGLISDVHPATVAEWLPEDRAAVRAWAISPETSYDDMPAVLGRPHIAAIVTDDAKVQTCQDCGSVLRTFDDPGDAYPAGSRVRTDCAGAQPEPEHHYPERKTKSAARKRDEVKKSAPKSAEKKAGKKKGTR